MVDVDGSIRDIQIVQSVDPLLDAEAIRVVKLTEGKWTFCQTQWQAGKGI